MYDCGLRIRRKYPPSQKFAEALSKQLEEWEEFVSTVGESYYIVVILHSVSSIAL